MFIYYRSEQIIPDNEDNTSLINTPVDTGSYQLVITKEVDCNVYEVTNLVQQYVPEFILMADTEAQIIFSLPTGKKNQFGALFSAIEFQKQNFNLKSVKITNPTTGDIYLK